MASVEHVESERQEAAGVISWSRGRKWEPSAPRAPGGTSLLHSRPPLSRRPQVSAGSPPASPRAAKEPAVARRPAGRAPSAGRGPASPAAAEPPQPGDSLALGRKRLIP